MQNPVEKAKSIGRDVKTKVERKVRDVRQGPLEEQTRRELYERARELGIEGRSRMKKAELLRAVRRAR